MMSLFNEGELYEILEQAAENATGRDDVDVAEYVSILEDEWITDVDALKRLDRDALDELLPLGLSRELQCLIHKGRRRTHFNPKSRWQRSPPQVKLSGISRPRILHHVSDGKAEEDCKEVEPMKEPSSPPGVTPICDEESSESSSVDKEDQNPKPASAVSEAPAKPRPLSPTEVLAASTVKGKNQRRKKRGLSLVKMFDLLDHWCSYSSFKDDGEKNEIMVTTDEGIDDDVLQRMSMDNPLMADARERANHLVADASRRAEFIGGAKDRFTTREELEDAIRDLEARLEREQKDEEAAAAEASNNDSKYRVKESLLTSTAEDELRSLYPMRFVLPTVGDLMEMVRVLQKGREEAMRDLDMNKASVYQWEIDGLQSQIDMEERYLLKKRMSEMDCISCGERFAIPAGETTMTVKCRHCEKCREVFGNDGGVGGEERRSSLLERVLSMATTEDKEGDGKEGNHDG